MNPSLSIARYLDRFFNHYLAVQKGLSTNTILAYRDTIKLLLCFTADTLKKSPDQLALTELDHHLILAFLDYIENQRGCSSRTRNSRLAAIRTFFSFISREAPALLLLCQKIRSIPQKRTEHKTIAYLDEKEMQALLDSVQFHSRTAMRDKALLLMLYNTGARVTELVTLTINDLRLDASGQVKLLGKGKKQRACPLWPETVTAIKDYLALRNSKNTNDNHLFLNANGRPITRFGIRYLTKKYAKAAVTKCTSISNKAVGPHTFRHSTAMHLIRAGNDINLVSYWLGHANLNTTHIYVEIDMDMKRKILDNCLSPAIKNSKLYKWQQPKIIQWLSELSKGHKLCAVNYNHKGEFV